MELSGTLTAHVEPEQTPSTHTELECQLPSTQTLLPHLAANPLPCFPFITTISDILYLSVLFPLASVSPKILPLLRCRTNCYFLETLLTISALRYPIHPLSSPQIALKSIGCTPTCLFFHPLPPSYRDTICLHRAQARHHPLAQHSSEILSGPLCATN